MSALENLQRQLDTLNEEWRKEVRGRFDDLDIANAEMGKRVRKLEDTKTKAVGAVTTVQCIGLLALWVLNKVTGGNH